jgi:hypothetical protein
MPCTPGQLRWYYTLAISSATRSTADDYEPRTTMTIMDSEATTNSDSDQGR